MKTVSNRSSTFENWHTDTFVVVHFKSSISFCIIRNFRFIIYTYDGDWITVIFLAICHNERNCQLSWCIQYYRYINIILVFVYHKHTCRVPVWSTRVDALKHRALLCQANIIKSPLHVTQSKVLGLRMNNVIIKVVYFN